MPAHALTLRIGEVLELQPDAASIEYNGHWSTWRQVAGLAGAIKALDVEPRQVGILLRNRPSHVAAFLGGRRHQPVPRRGPYSRGHRGAGSSLYRWCVR